MRKSLLILSIMPIFLSQYLFSQLREPNQHKFYLTDSVYLNGNDPAFRINRFHLGWHWADGRIIINYQI